ncbi:anti-lipopolysaccharide factor isoform X3 [Pocillopora verrucosa]|uniref:anti-lipopolysaccharide factor isoform X3 n=1 Tax=Pocillopora verrucosa TaxID=203993 RepID=UPI003340E866
MDVIKDIAHLYSFLQSVTGKSGQLNFKGRVIEYKAEGRIHKLKWVYDGTAWDVESGTSVEARHYKSTQGAIEHAVKKLIDDLKAKGILN